MVVSHAGPQLLPPSGRDFDVFRLVRVDQRSTREAAAAAQISQTRVRQVVERVEAFLVEARIRQDGDDPRAARVWLAEQIAAERVDKMYGRAVRAYDAERVNQPKFLMAATRMAMYGAKLPASAIGYGACEEEEEIKEAPPAQQPVQPVVVIEVPAAKTPAEREVEVAKVVAEEVAAPIAPPVGDCSLAAPKAAVAAESSAVEIAASREEKKDSEDDYRLAVQLKLPSQRPAQQGDSSGNTSSGKRLNRKQRRARLQFLKAEG